MLRPSTSDVRETIDVFVEYVDTSKKTWRFYFDVSNTRVRLLFKNCLCNDFVWAGNGQVTFNIPLPYVKLFLTFNYLVFIYFFKKSIQK